MATKCEIKEGKDHKPEIPFPKFMQGVTTGDIYLFKDKNTAINISDSNDKRPCVDDMHYYTDIPLGTIIECQNTLGD